MTNAFRTLILPASVTPLAQQIAASFGSGAVGMWTTGLSASGNDPATHYISTGIIPEEFAYMMPTQYWAYDENGNWAKNGSDDGNVTAVWQGAVQAGVNCTLAQVQNIFEVADVTEQEPFTALQRLNLKIINIGM